MERRIGKVTTMAALLAAIALSLTGCATEGYGYRDGNRGSVVYMQTSPHRYWDQGGYYIQSTPHWYRNNPNYWRNSDRRDCDDDRNDHRRWDND